jgi:hypothetical protein
MWRWFAKARPPKQASSGSSAARHRLFLLATALVARGMKPDQAYKIALYYIQGPGRGRTWMNALAEEDARSAARAISGADLHALTGRVSTDAMSAPPQKIGTQ